MSRDVPHPQASLPSPCDFLRLRRANRKARSSVLLPKECKQLPTSSYTQSDAQDPTRIRKHHLDFHGQAPPTAGLAWLQQAKSTNTQARHGSQSTTKLSCETADLRRFPAPRHGQQEATETSHLQPSRPRGQVPPAGRHIPRRAGNCKGGDCWCDLFSPNPTRGLTVLKVCPKLKNAPHTQK